MRKILVILAISTAFLSCKSDKNETKSQVDIQAQEYDRKDLILTGNFIYYDGVAVLQTKDEIYGVIVDSMLEDLNKQAENFKKEDTDMVPVTVRAKLSNKKDNTEWENKIEILEIIKVSEPKAEDNQVIKLQ